MGATLRALAGEIASLHGALAHVSQGHRRHSGSEMGHCGSYCAGTLPSVTTSRTYGLPEASAWVMAG
jgi:hypothetical protein